MSGFNRKNKSRGKTTGASSGSGRGSGFGSGITRGRGDDISNGDGSSRGRVILPTIPTGPNGNGFGSSLDPLNGATYDGSTKGKNWGADLLRPFLNSLVGSGSGSIVDILDQAAKGGLHLSTEQEDTLYQFLLQYVSNIDQRSYDQQLTQDKRQYDWSLLQDARKYDSPTNQLARLMGAGISRDAALQMMSGSGNGAGSGTANGEPVTGTPASAPSMIATSGTQNLNIANTILGGIDTLSSLVSTGLSVPQSISQIKMLRNQAYLTQKQREAYDDASQAFYLLSSSGIPLDSDSYGSISATVDSLNDLAEKGNKAAKSFIENGGAERLATNAPYASQFFKELYRNERASSDYSQLYDLDVGQKQAQITLMHLEEDKLVAETDKLNSEVLVNTNLAEVYDRQVIFYEEQVKLIEEQIKTEPHRRAYLDAQRKESIANAKLAREQAEYYKANTQSVVLANTQTESWMNGVDPDTGKTGLQLQSERTILGLLNDTRELAYTKDKGLFQVKVDAMYNNFEKSMAIDALHHAYATGQLNALARQEPEFKQYLYLCRCWDDLGVFKDRELKLTAGKYDNKFWVFGASGYNKSLDLDITDPYNHIK